MTLSIQRAGLEQSGEVADLIARSFHDLEVAEWLVADPDARLTKIRAQFEMLVVHAVKHGYVYLTADRTGAAVWVDQTVPVPEPEQYDPQLRQICGPHLERFQALDEAFEAHHPSQPHHHLEFLAVRKEAQGNGIGTALLQLHHEYLDSKGIAAYLEASNSRTRDLYTKYNYSPTSLIELPDGPQMWPMWREPAA